MAIGKPFENGGGSQLPFWIMMTSGEITSIKWRRIRFFWLLAIGTLVSDRSRLWEQSTGKGSTVREWNPRLEKRWAFNCLRRVKTVIKE